MGKNLKALFFFLFTCGVLFAVFTLWAHRAGLCSAEIYFFSFRAQQNPNGVAKNLFLTYPALPSFFAFLYPSVILLPVTTGILVTIFLLPRLFPTEPLLLGLLILATIASPFFLSALSITPTLLLFFVLLLCALSNLLRYQEEQSVYYLFLGGIFFGATVLSHPHVEWFALATAIFVLFFFPGNLTRKFGLLLVFFFPVLAFLGIIMFLNWVYTTQALSFLRAPYSFFPYLPSFSFQNVKHAFSRWQRWYLFLPLLVSMFQDRKRALLGATLFLGSAALPSFPPLFATVATLGALFLKKPSLGKTGRLVLSLSLGVSVASGWILFLLSPAQLFLFAPYEPLQEKLTEYREIASFLAPQATVLLLDGEYFLASSWGKAVTTVTPESPFFEKTLTSLSCDYILSAGKSETFPGFRKIFQGENVSLYRKRLP